MYIGKSVGVAVGRCLGGRLATTLVATIFIIISSSFSPHFFPRFFFSPVFFPVSPSQPFLIEGVLGSKNLFCESCLKWPITLCWTPFQTPSAILGAPGSHFYVAGGAPCAARLVFALFISKQEASLYNTIIIKLGQITETKQPFSQKQIEVYQA